MVAGQKRKAGILMKSAYNKEIWRAIRKGKKRFFSIMLITILGVGMLTGLRAACMDLRYSADQFYDRQGLYDISVVSTLGLTEKDVDALKTLDGVADAVGVYSETVHAKVNDHEVSIAVCTLNDSESISRMCCPAGCRRVRMRPLLQPRLPMRRDAASGMSSRWIQQMMRSLRCSAAALP